MLGSLEICIAGESMVALPQKALWWPSRGTLFVADVHLGKEASFQAQSIPIPMGPTAETLNRLDALIRSTRAEHLILLGDLWHAKSGRTPKLVDDFIAWRTRHQTVKMTLVEGNHDLKSGKLPANSNFEEVAEPFLVPPFALSHYPEPCADGYVLCGHIHPGVLLEGRGRQSMKLPCFWIGKRVAVLPAFGEFTGCARVSPVEGDQVMVVAEDQVIRVPLVS